MNKRDVKLTQILFFIFGMEIMSWVPRFPEVKAFLAVKNGVFGSMMSAGAFGSLVALLTIGHLVDHFGAKRLLITGFTLLTLGFIGIIHVHNHELFILLNILLGFSISTLHISNNAQAFLDQERGGKNLVVSAAGYWSAGSLVTTLLSMFLIDRVSLQVHITVLSLVCWALAIVIIYMRHETLIQANRHESVSRSIYQDLRKFKFDWIIYFGSIFGIMLEFSIGDWSAIFAKENGKISATLAPLPFLVFTVFMIIGRLSITSLRKRFDLARMVQFGGLLAGSSFIIGIWTVHKTGLAGLLVAFAMAGIGSSYIGPSFMNVANTRINLPSSIVIGQISAINVVLSWILKQVVAFLAQVASLQVALTLPAAMAICVGLFTKVFKPAQAK